MSTALDAGRSRASASASKRDWTALTPSLSGWVLDAIASLGFRQMTPVQASTIPLFMGNKDVVVEAVTGSGKTLAFLIPAVEKALKADEAPKRHHIQTIILSPTRELASQTYGVLETLLAFHTPSAVHLERADDPATDEEDSVPAQSLPPSIAPKIVGQLLLGGTTSPAQDIATFLNRSPNFIVATPGRLLELLSSPHVHCTQSSFEMLVLDEADRLLDLGFSDALQKILSRLPKQRRTGLFSASMSEALDQLIRVGLRNPVKVAVRVKSATGKSEGKTPASLQLRYVAIPPQHKLPAMCKLLASLTPPPQKVVCYLSTCAAVDYFSRVLQPLLPDSFALVPLHGKHPPQVRTRNFSRFMTSPDATILLTTDVAARGLDIPNVDLVLQLDPPSDPKTFVHRCGRAGRAGRRGLAVTFLSQGREEDYVEFLSLRGTPVTLLSQPDITVTAAEAAHATETIREQVRADRALFDTAQRAFVSWVRSYAKHSANGIFNVRELDWSAVADAWGLLRLPKMPEAKDWTGDRGLGLKVDWARYSYKDNVREKRRLDELAAPATHGRDGTNAALKHSTNTKNEAERKQEKAWTRKKEGQKTREERREKRTSKKERERVSKMTDEERLKEAELEAMISEVRRRNTESFAAGKSTSKQDDDEWAGFSD